MSEETNTALAEAVAQPITTALACVNAQYALVDIKAGLDNIGVLKADAYECLKACDEYGMHKALVAREKELADKLDVLGGRFEGDQDSEMVRAECQKQDQRHRDTDQPKQR